MEQNTAIAQAATQTADAAAWTATPSPTPPATDTPPATETPIPTETSVLLDVATETPTEEVTPDPRTATVEARNTEVALTQAAQAEKPTQNQTLQKRRQGDPPGTINKIVERSQPTQASRSAKDQPGQQPNRTHRD